MGSKTFDGVWFISYSNDHLPPHVHGRLGKTQVILDLFENLTVRKSKRRNAIRPPNAKRGDVRRILEVATAHASELMELWEKAHGTAS